MSATATAEPIERNRTTGHLDFVDSTPNVGVLRTCPATPEELTEEERACLLAKSKNYDEFTDNAIAYGKLTGDFTIDRHILPQPTLEEIWADVRRLEAEHPERLLSLEQIAALAGRV